MIHVGDIINATPENFAGRAAQLGVPTAKVTYIHPEARFYCIEFTFSNGTKYTESREIPLNERSALIRAGVCKQAKKLASDVSDSDEFYGYSADRDMLRSGKNLGDDDISAIF